MIETIGGEQALAEFLKETQNNELRTWQRPRTSQELSSFVLEKLDFLDEAIE